MYVLIKDRGSVVVAKTLAELAEYIVTLYLAVNVNRVRD